MKDYNTGKILYNAFIGKDTRLGKNTYRVVEQPGVWEIYRCPTNQVGREWIDHEGYVLTAWQLSTIIPYGEKMRFLRAYRPFDCHVI